MKTLKITVFIISSILCLANILSAQKGKTFIVNAGLKVEDCIPFDERFRFPEFTDGKVIFTKGTNSQAKLNYNYLIREMQFLQGKDTLSIANEKDILGIYIAGEVFIINKGYLELIFDDKVQVGVKEYFNLIDTRKKDPYGDIGSGAATDSYSSLHSNGQYNKLTVTQDRIFQKVSDYYLAASSREFVPFTKKKVLQLFPKNKNGIEDYLKWNKVDFDSRNDLVRFAEFLSKL